MSRLDRAPKVDVDVAVNSSDWAKEVVAQELASVEKFNLALGTCNAEGLAKCEASAGKDLSLFGQEFNPKQLCAQMQLFCFAQYVAPQAVPDFQECTKAAKDPFARSDCRQKFNETIETIIGEHGDGKLSQKDKLQAKTCLRSFGPLECVSRFFPAQRQAFESCVADNDFSIDACQDETKDLLGSIGGWTKSNFLDLTE